MVEKKTLQELINAAEAIQADQKLSSHRKDIQLAKLMDYMEGEYSVPMLRNPEWELKNPGIAETYRKISCMRSF